MIRYINSEGKEYKFYDARVRATSGNFHKHAWTPETSKRKIGETVQGFEKDAAKYEITFTVRGALEDRKTFLDEMQDAFETDVLLESPGRKTERRCQSKKETFFQAGDRKRVKRVRTSLLD